jgi:hypothetical protein
MNGMEIITYLGNNLSAITTPIAAVAGSIFTVVFLRKNTATQEFEKIKAGKFKEVAEDLLNAGEMTHMEFYKANNFLQIAKKADSYYKEHPKSEEKATYDFF